MIKRAPPEVNGPGSPVPASAPTPAPASRKRGIDSVEVAGVILQASLRLGVNFRLKDLEHETGIPSATLYRYMVSLAQCGLVQRVEGGTRYTLGLLAFQLGQRASQGSDLVSLAAPHVQEFSEGIGETCAIGLWFDQGATIVRWFEVNSAISVSLRLGAVLPVLGSSTARVLAANLPREATEPVICQELMARDGKATALEAVYTELSQVKTAGIASAEGTHILGISSLSVPVLGHDGHAVMAIAVIGNQLSFSASPESDTASKLRALGARLSSYVGSR